jgi:hypothetical protein
MHDGLFMFKISDPKDKVYYIEDLTSSADGSVDPLKPFSFWTEANDYARDVLKLDVDEYKIIEWEVD